MVKLHVKLHNSFASLPLCMISAHSMFFAVDLHMGVVTGTVTHDSKINWLEVG